MNKATLNAISSQMNWLSTSGIQGYLQNIFPEALPSGLFIRTLREGHIPEVMQQRLGPLLQQIFRDIIQTRYRFSAKTAIWPSALISQILAQK